MVVNHQPKLTAAEVSNLWATYQAGTMTLCGMNYFLSIIDDPDTRGIIEFAVDFTQKRVQTVTQLLNAEHYPTPKGFKDQDVDTNAPRLFSDTMILYYIMNMGRLNLSLDSVMLSTSARDDVAAFFSECVTQSKELVDKGRKLAIQKGIFIRVPIIPTPDKVDYVKKQSFLNGWFGEQRPLLGAEINNLFYNAERNALGNALITGFSQVTQTKEVKQFMLRGKEISEKHFEIFSSFLNKENLSSAKNITSEVTNSTVPPFSDKLMMFHIAGVIASGIGQYGLAISTSPRHDLGLMYMRLMAETGKYAEDGAKILINNGWMEEPPKAADRDELAKRKG